MIVVFKDLSKQSAHDYSLVLSSSGIFHRILDNGFVKQIQVAEDQVVIARRLIAAYRLENPSLPVDGSHQEDALNRNYSGIYIALVLMTVHMAVINSADPHAYVQTYSASARLISGGELYRCITALILHGDVAHLAGNMAGIALFGSVVCSVTGSGAGWLLILLSGFFGNFINAWFFQTSHFSIGASTAVFGAVGILTALQSISAVKHHSRWKKVFHVIAGGLAVLAILGAGRHSDVTAHLFGFVAGSILGVVYDLATGRQLSGTGQVLCGAGAVCILAASWLKGYF